MSKRGVKIGGAPSTAPHLRDGETVSLDDPAWQGWRAGVELVEGLPIEDAVLRRLLDNLATAFGVTVSQALHDLDRRR